MIRIRAYSFTLCLPLLIAIVGLLIFVATNEIGGVDSTYVGLGTFAFGWILQAIFGLAFACPRCSKSPYAFGPFRGPFSLGGKPVPDRVCSNCGYKLAAAQGE